jgi:hypothetical protein
MPSFAIPGSAVDGRPSQAARLRARLRGWNLDAELAGGSDPSSRAELAARAAWLRRSRHRRQLAAGLEHLVRECERPPTLTASPPIHRPTIRAARADLLELAAQLRGPHALDPRGIAMVRRLLVNDQSPLHIGGIDQLRSALVVVRAALGEGGN